MEFRLSSRNQMKPSSNADQKKASWPDRIVLACFVLLTLGTGLLLRLQMTGLTTSSFFGLDLRRAHSHLGFYGVLFPIAWQLLSSATVSRAHSTSAPKGWLLNSYYLLVAASFLGFLWQGYGLVAIIGSTGVLAVWLIYARRIWQPSLLFKRDWIVQGSLSLLLAAILIPAVAVLTRREPALATQLARTFLSLLIMGVFVPVALNRLEIKAPRAWLWFLASCLSAVHLSGFGQAFGLGSLVLGVVIARGVWESRLGQGDSSQLRLKVYWLVFASMLALTGVGAVEHSHFISIAGIHFLFLGPLLLTFFLAQFARAPGGKRRFSLVYETSVIGMVSSIALMQWSADLGLPLLVLQRVAAAFGALILVCVAVVIFKYLMLRSGRESLALGVR